jgi:hypothetical protein
MNLLMKKRKDSMLIRKSPYSRMKIHVLDQDYLILNDLLFEEF